MGVSLSDADQLPSQTPLVSGWVGFAERAQAKTCGSKARTSSCLFVGSESEYGGPLPLSGSFHRSHASTRGSFANPPTTPRTYASRRGYCVSSRSAFAPGLCTHPELWTPGIGGCCGPSLVNGS